MSVLGSPAYLRHRTPSGLAMPSLWAGAAAVTVGVSFLLLIVGRLPSFDAGVQIHAQDIVCACLIALATVEMVRLRRLPMSVGALLALSAIILVQLINGVVNVGLTQAGNESRGPAYFIAAAVFFGIAPAHGARGAMKVIAAFAVTLAVVALARWAILASGSPLADLWADVGGGKAIRVLNASHALLICQGALIAAVWALAQNYARRTTALWMVVALLTVIVLQHRTVWLAGAAGLLWLMFRTYRARPAAWRRGAAIACIALPIAVFIAALCGALTAETFTSLTELSDPNSTLAWRIKGWGELLNQPISASEWIFGSPFGGGYLRMIDGVVRFESPHNFFLQTFLRAGASGVLLLLTTYGLLFWKTHRGARGLCFESVVAEVIVVTQLVFFMAYSPGVEQGILLGIAIALAFHAKERRDGAA